MNKEISLKVPKYVTPNKKDITSIISGINELIKKNSYCTVNQFCDLSNRDHISLGDQFGWKEIHSSIIQSNAKSQNYIWTLPRAHKIGGTK